MSVATTDRSTAGGRHLARRYDRDPAAFPEPDSKQELWRFAALPRLRPLFAGPPADAELGWVVDGPLAPATIAMADPRVGRVLTPFDRVGAVAMLQAGQAQLLRVDAELTDPVTVTMTGRGGTSYGHLVVEVAAGAAGVVVLDQTGTGRCAVNVELLVGEEGRLTVISLQDWAPDAVSVQTHAAELGRDARLRHVSVVFGGGAVRLSPTVRFAAPGGDAELLGLYYADAGQHVDHRLLVDHSAPSCRSRVTYKGALQGEGARSVWTGDVVIRPTARGTDTYEVNRNLLLTDGTRADSVPNLEIETGEVVQAGHASATGRFDDEQLFYLQSRGISEPEARRLVVRGFFAELVARIGLPTVEERLLTAVEAELTRSPVSEEP